MKHVNRAVRPGRPGADPKRLAAHADRPAGAFPVATTARWRTDAGDRQEATERHHVAMFGPPADPVPEYLKKGSAALVEGRLKARTRTDDDGAERRTVEIAAGDVNVLGRRAAP